MDASDTLHEDEWAITDRDARHLVDTQFPHWAHLPLRTSGSGTDNRMFRLGEHLVVRLPRTEGTTRALAVELDWLPRLAPHLPLPVPTLVARGHPNSRYPFNWAVYRWIEGRELDVSHMDDHERLGADLAGFVASLHAIDLMGATRRPPLDWYRGARLAEVVPMMDDYLRASEERGLPVDHAAVRAVWREGLAADDPGLPHTWLHADLRPTNLIERDGRLAGVVDFGGLCIGDPTCEHAALWDMPAGVRLTYADALGLDAATRTRARAWAVMIGLSGMVGYETTWPSFAAASLARIQRTLTEPL